MSIKTNPTAPTNATKAVAVVSDEMIKEAWGFDDIGDIVVYVILGINYAVSIVPLFGSLVTMFTRAPMGWYLIFDGVMKLLDMNK